jgi:DNA-binding NarL/FixJ family response regulator
MLLDSQRQPASEPSRGRGHNTLAARSAPSVLLVGRDPLYRNGLRLVLEETGLRVAGEVSSGDEAVAFTAEHRPAVIIVDMRAGARAVEIVRRLNDLAPSPCVLALGETEWGGDITEAITAGANGYLLKGAAPHEIAAAIRAAAAGALVLPPSAASLLRDGGVRRTSAIPLTPRELQVLGLIADGRDNGAIAAELFISRRTAKSHVSHILRKLEAGNRTEAAVHAARMGLV